MEQRKECLPVCSKVLLSLADTALRRIGMDLEENRTIFIGGGSILLKSYIEMVDIVSKSLFIDNVHANVESYGILYDNQKAGRT